MNRLRNYKPCGCYIGSMVLFGTIGVFVRYIPLHSGTIALVRGFIGMAFLLILAAVQHRKTDHTARRHNIFALCLGGACLGANWILLFEAYRYTTVAAATLCYYLAPVFVILLSPAVFRERLSPKNVICVSVAVVGMVFVSGIFDSKLSGNAGFKGVLCGLGAAVLYALVLILNKKASAVNAYDKTVIELGVSTVLLIPYVLLTKTGVASRPTPLLLFLLLLVGVLHTGVAYALYFYGLQGTSAKTAALLSYIDPVVAIALSALLLREQLSLFGWCGAAMILGAVFYNTFTDRSKQNEKTI